MTPYFGKMGVRIFCGATEKIVHGGTVNSPAIERAGPEKLPPKDARRGDARSPSETALIITRVIYIRSTLQQALSMLYMVRFEGAETSSVRNQGVRGQGVALQSGSGS